MGAGILGREIAAAGVQLLDERAPVGERAVTTASGWKPVRATSSQ